MDRTIRLRLAATFLILGWALTASAGQDQRPSSNPPSAPYGGATVSDWTGKVLVQPPGSLLAVPTRQQALPPGTLLDTGDGRLLLRLEDESEILVRPHTRLLLTQPGPGAAPETPVPIQEIRPGFEASDERMAAEFAREGVVDVNRGPENEMVERADSQAEELEEEAREGREGPQDPDHDENKPKQ